MARSNENEFLNEQSAGKYDYPDFYAPQAWGKRRLPDNIIPDGVWLPTFLDVIGKELFPDLWNGTEIYARSPEEILHDKEGLSQWLLQKKAIEKSLASAGLADRNELRGSQLRIFKDFISPIEAAVSFYCQEEENAAFMRKEKSIKLIVEKILKNEIKPFQISARGEKSEIIESWWRRAGIRSSFEYGCAANSNNLIYISNTLIERKQSRPNSICFPEGVDNKIEKPLGTRERETLLKLIIGMAIKGYSFDPKASKSGTIREICDDLSSLGLNISDDTIRKWLKEATEYLPREE